MLTDSSYSYNLLPLSYRALLRFLEVTHTLFLIALKYNYISLKKIKK